MKDDSPFRRTLVGCSRVYRTESYTYINKTAIEGTATISYVDFYIQ